MSWWDSTKKFFGRLIRRQSNRVGPSLEDRLNPPDPDQADILEWQKEMKAQSKRERRLWGLRRKKELKSKKGEIPNENGGKHRTSNVVDEKVGTMEKNEVDNSKVSPSVSVTRVTTREVEENTNEESRKCSMKNDTVSVVSFEHHISSQDQKSILEAPSERQSIRKDNEFSRPEKVSKDNSDKKLTAGSDNEDSQSCSGRGQSKEVLGSCQVSKKCSENDIWDDIAEEFLYTEEEPGEFSFYPDDEEEEYNSEDSELPEEEDIWRKKAVVEVWIKSTLPWVATYSDSNSDDDAILTNNLGLDDPTIFVSHVIEPDPVKCTRMSSLDESRESENQNFLDIASIQVFELGEPKRRYTKIVKNEDWTEYFGSDDEDHCEKKKSNSGDSSESTSSQRQLTLVDLALEDRSSPVESTDSGLKEEVSDQESLYGISEQENLIRQKNNSTNQTLNLVCKLLSGSDSSDQEMSILEQGSLGEQEKVPERKSSAENLVFASVSEDENKDLTSAEMEMSPELSSDLEPEASDLRPGSLKSQEEVAITGELVEDLVQNSISSSRNVESLAGKLDKKPAHAGLARRCVRWISRKMKPKKSSSVAPGILSHTEIPSSPSHPKASKVKTDKLSDPAASETVKDKPSVPSQRRNIKTEKPFWPFKAVKVKPEKSSSPCEPQIEVKRSSGPSQPEKVKTGKTTAPRHSGKVKSQKPTCPGFFGMDKSQITTSPYRRGMALRQKKTSPCDSLYGEVTLRMRKKKTGSQDWIRFPEGN